MPTTPKKLLRDILETHGPLVAEAFLKAVSEAVNRASVKAIADALASGNYDLALDILGLTEQAFESVAESVRTTYLASGRSVSGWIGGVSSAQVQFMFRPGDPVAAEWMRTKSSALVQRITEGQREGIREALGRGMDAGRNPRTVALDIAGRIPKGANMRQGGLVGLTRSQMQTVDKIRSDLLSGDPKRMRDYLRLNLRDRRFDASVQRAIRAGTGLTPTEVTRLTERYADKALKWRADNIARTEANQAFQASQEHSMRQAMEGGFIQQAEKTWVSASDDRVRFSHSVLNGQTVPMDGVFVSPIGSMMKHPGDASLGALTEDIIQCRCTMTYRVVS